MIRRIYILRNKTLIDIIDKNNEIVLLRRLSPDETQMEITKKGFIKIIDDIYYYLDKIKIFLGTHNANET